MRRCALSISDPRFTKPNLQKQNLSKQTYQIKSTTPNQTKHTKPTIKKQLGVVHKLRNHFWGTPYFCENTQPLGPLCLWQCFHLSLSVVTALSWTPIIRLMFFSEVKVFSPKVSRKQLEAVIAQLTPI